jgi:hypothetical protein
MSGHTEGPWTCIPWSGQIEVRTKDNKTGGIAFLGNREEGAIPTAQTRANAKLIAAAPEMLEAANNLLVNARDIGECFNGDGNMYDDWKALEEAVEKAEDK